MTNCKKGPHNSRSCVQVCVQVCILQSQTLIFLKSKRQWPFPGNYLSHSFHFMAASGMNSIRIHHDKYSCHMEILLWMYTNVCMCVHFFVHISSGINYLHPVQWVSYFELLCPEGRTPAGRVKCSSLGEMEYAIQVRRKTGNKHDIDGLDLSVPVLNYWGIFLQTDLLSWGQAGRYISHQGHVCSARWLRITWSPLLRSHVHSRLTIPHSEARQVFFG